MTLTFKIFRSQGFSDTQVEPTAEKAAAFATTLRPDQLVSVSHVLDGHIHIVTVWYWQDGPPGGG